MTVCLYGKEINPSLEPNDHWFDKTVYIMMVNEGMNEM